MRPAGPGPWRAGGRPAGGGGGDRGHGASGVRGGVPGRPLRSARRAALPDPLPGGALGAPAASPALGGLGSWWGGRVPRRRGRSRWAEGWQRGARTCRVGGGSELAPRRLEVLLRLGAMELEGWAQVGWSSVQGIA